MADALPVCRARTGFHQQERFPFQAAHQIVLHSRIQRYGPVIHLMPGRIIVPGNHIQLRSHSRIIQPFKIIHHIGRHRKIRTTFPDRADLIFHKIRCLIGDKTLPVQSQTLNRLLPDRRRAFHLGKIRIGMAPESGTPAAVETIQSLVTLFHPLPECSLTEGTMTFSAEFIGNMPHTDCRMFSEASGQFAVHLINLFPVNR